MKRVLIVDDAIELGRLFQDALKTAHPGMPITVVPSAEEALLEATRLTIDLLVTDIRLPGMSGLELVRKIRVRQPHVKVLVITGLSPDSHLQKQLDDSKVDAFRRKPLGMADFLEIADGLLGFENEPAAHKPAPIHTAAVPPATPLTRDEELLNALTAAMPGEAVSAQEKAQRLRQTGSLRLPQPPPPEGLSTRLSSLRGRLGAQVVLLLDERGHVVAQAGDLPSDLLESLLSPLAASLSAAARISHLLGQSAAETVQAYRGVAFDLVSAPVGQYALLLALKPGRSALRLALAFEEALNAQNEISQDLQQMGLLVQTALELGVPEASLPQGARPEDLPVHADEPVLEGLLSQDPELEKLQALFQPGGNRAMKLPDADSFWEQALRDENDEDNAPGTLNYQQAQKLGLLPEDEQGK